MTGSRTQSGPAPTYLRITLGEGTPTPTQSHQADRPASADSMHRAGPASRPFVLATLRALRLDPGPNPVLSTRSPKTSKTTAQQPLDTPRPFRDDSPHRLPRHLLQPGRQLPGVHVPRDGGQWTRNMHKLPGCHRTRPRRTPPDNPARAGSPTTIPAVNIAIWGRWLTAPRMPPERPNTMEEKSLPNHRRLPVGMNGPLSVTLPLMTERPFVPTDFVVPRELVEPGFRLAPLGPEHNAADHAAWSGSMEHIRATPGFAGRPWPHVMSASQNLADLEQHAADFAARTGFTYTVLPTDRPDAQEVLGCVYIYLPEDGDPGAASIRSWVRADPAALDTGAARAAP